MSVVYVTYRGYIAQIPAVQIADDLHAESKVYNSALGRAVPTLTPIYRPSKTEGVLEVPAGAVEALRGRNPDTRFETVGGWAPRLGLRFRRIPGLEPTLAQSAALKALRGHWCGGLDVPTSGGKTEMELLIAHAASQDHNVLVPCGTDIIRKNFLTRAKQYGLPVSDWRDMRKSPSFREAGGIVVATPMAVLNDIKSGESFSRVIATFGTIVADEAHRFRAETWQSLLWALPGLRRCYGLSGTLVKQTDFISFRQLSHADASVYAAIGPVRHHVSVEDVAETLEPPVAIDYVFDWRNRCPSRIVQGSNWHEIRVKALRDNAERRAEIVRVIHIAAQEGFNLFVPTAERGSAELLWESFPGEGKSVLSFGGGKNTIEGGDTVSNEELAERFRDGRLRHLFATPHIDEGFNVPALNCLVATEGVSSTRHSQRVGRTLRKGAGVPVAINFYDRNAGILEGHSATRRDSLARKFGNKSFVAENPGQLQRLLRLVKTGELKA